MKHYSAARHGLTLLALSIVCTANMAQSVKTANEPFVQNISIKKSPALDLPIEALAAPTPANTPQGTVAPVQVGTELPSATAIPAAPELSWSITSEDQTVSVALSRWATSSGWQLAWQAPRDLPAFRVSYAGDFEYAVESLMRDSHNSEYPLHACLYDNRVVRVLHITQSCAR